MFQSRQVQIGTIKLGGEAPIVLQSMTSTDTNDIEATVSQCIRIFDAGGQMVRLTTQSLREVLSLKKIRDELHRKGYRLPLVADVHFQPKVAEEAAKIVEKVRINPGNYFERKYTGPKKFSKIEQNKQSKSLRERLIPLIRICKEHNTAIRIGVNHGSLSERIMNWYGDTPEGMVESALEFIRVFEKEKFRNLVISIKSSNTRIMVYTNRLLMKRMYEEEFNFPIHLGVTEAGDEEDGRIKSAVGIGALLVDGIGDTLRVSLTEDSEKEIPVAKRIADNFGTRENLPDFILERSMFFEPYEYKRRQSLPSESIGGNHVPIVIAGTGRGDLRKDNLREMGYKAISKTTLEASKQAADFVFLNEMQSTTSLASGIKLITCFKEWKDNYSKQRNFFPLIKWKEYGMASDHIFGHHFIEVDDMETPAQFFKLLDNDLYGALILTINHEMPIHHSRNFFKMLGKVNSLLPVILHKKYNSVSKEDLLVNASTELGSLLNDGYGDGIWIEDENQDISDSYLRELSFNILQATGTRISKTEYVSCPSCGRTLFNIQSTLKKIKDATSEFQGLKIGVMGCIVNGPGEMADADFGYVGAGKGLVTLYKGKVAVKRNIPEEDAVEEMVGLIRENLG